MTVTMSMEQYEEMRNEEVECGKAMVEVWDALIEAGAELPECFRYGGANYVQAKNEPRFAFQWGRSVLRAAAKELRRKAK